MSEKSACPDRPDSTSEIQGYRDVRKAAKNYRAYSSDLLADDPEVRDYRQLPLETDPPRHTQLRACLMPLFAAEAIEVRVPEFIALAKRLAAKVTDAGSADLVSDFALPYVMGCLGIIYNRPQDVQEWIDWGPDVWFAEAYRRGKAVTEETKSAEGGHDHSANSRRSGRIFHNYLERVLAEARNTTGHPREPNDVWQFLVDARPGGEPMTHHEVLGTASVILAGGRDTLIKLISGLLWHLIGNPQDREYLQENPHHRAAAITEIARYLSPLRKMARVDVEASREAGEESHVLLSFVSGNFDDSQFPDPERLDIYREEKPNLAFGFGRHSCLGMQVTMHEATALLDAMLSDWPQWQLAGEPHLVWSQESVGERTVRILASIESLPVVAPAL